MKRAIVGFLSTCLVGSQALCSAADAPLAQAQVGKPAPDFTLPTTEDGKTVSLKNAAGKFVVLEWTNYSCPFVRKHYESGNMQKLQKTYTGKGVLWYSICSSAPGRQGYYTAAEAPKVIKENKAVPTAYLFDPDGKTGKSYGATATPHMYVVNPKGVLIYAGAIDDNPSADIEAKPAKNYVAQALDEAMAGKPVTSPATQSYGCSIKYAR